jgi:hypothetical protein
MFRLKGRMPTYTNKDASRDMSTSEKKITSCALILDRREASWLMAAVILLCLFVFLVGYFLGQRAATSSLMHDIHTEAFTDQASSAVYAMPNDVSSELEPSDAASAFVEKTITARTDETPAPHESEVSAPQPARVTPTKDSVFYRAALITTDIVENAQQVREDAHKRGVDIRIKKSTRSLKRAPHKKKTTYQLMTGPYASEEDLKHDLAIIKEIRGLKGSEPKIVKLTQSS